MNNEKAEELVKKIIQEVLKEIKNKNLNSTLSTAAKNSLNKNKNILVLMCGGDKKMDDVKFQIDKLAKENNISLIFSDAFKKIYGEDFINKNYDKHRILAIEIDKTKSIIDDCDVVLIPILTRNTCGKIVSGICDTVITNIITFALISQKKIIACEESCILPAKIKYSHFVAENMEKMEHLGIEMIKIERLYDAVCSQARSIEIRKKVITEIDVKELKQSNLVLKKGTIVTALALDKAREKGISIEFV